MHNGEGIAEIANRLRTMEKELRRLLNDRARGKANCRNNQASMHDGKRIAEIARRLCTMEKELKRLLSDRAR
jgi:hypothetical protein